MIEFPGRRLTIRYCETPPPGADPETWEPASWREAISHFPEKKWPSVKAKMVARRNQLVQGGQLRSPDHWNTEAELPDGKHFYAIKADKLRAYGWFSRREPGVFYISHFAIKRGKKLAAEDTNRIVANWRRIEERQR